MIVLVLQHVAGAFRGGMKRMPAGTAEMIGDFVRCDGEKIGLQLAGLVEVRQAVEKSDKSLLDNILACRPIVQPAIDKRQEPAFITSYQTVPGASIALADLLDQQSIAFIRHDPSLITDLRSAENNARMEF
jgi:hypothetical protein